jgi:hypothetical protein
MIKKSQIELTAIKSVLALVIGIIGAWIFIKYEIGGEKAWLYVSMGLFSVITFYSFIPVERDGTIGSLKNSIVASVIVTYLLLVITFTFYIDDRSEIPPLTNLLLTNFTMIVGVVIASYFGVTAYLEGKKRQEK